MRADLVGAQLRMEGIENLDRFHQIAMRSGARRILDLSLGAPLELNQLEDDFTVYGRMRVIFARQVLLFSQVPAEKLIGEL